MRPPSTSGTATCNSSSNRAARSTIVKQPLARIGDVGEAQVLHVLLGTAGLRQVQVNSLAAFLRVRVVLRVRALLRTRTAVEPTAHCRLVLRLVVLFAAAAVACAVIVVARITRLTSASYISVVHLERVVRARSYAPARIGAAVGSRVGMCGLFFVNAEHRAHGGTKTSPLHIETCARRAEQRRSVQPHERQQQSTQVVCHRHLGAGFLHGCAAATDVPHCK